MQTRSTTSDPVDSSVEAAPPPALCAPASSFDSPGDMLGEVVAGKYFVERVLGEGSMGVVVAARHLQLDELVALKVIRPDMRSDTEVRNRFSREAKIASRIRNEHVTRVLDAGESRRFGPYLVMEYLEGEPLEAVLSRHGALPLERALRYLLQACEGLRAAHAQGVVHRDVKPGNLFLSRREGPEQVKLLDFGISQAPLTGKVLGRDLSLGQTTHLIGTPLYMSPEQIRGARNLDARTDVWAVGMVLFELLTGRPAFAGRTVTETCSKILEKVAPRIDLAGAPLGLQQVIDRCLAKDREQRFASIAELSVALRQLLLAAARRRRARVGLVRRPWAWLLAAATLATVVVATFAARSRVGSSSVAPRALSGHASGAGHAAPLASSRPR